ncbi:PhzF family phenazine biosynthesis protein [Gloeocapsopsis dulcis]|uniref:Phenazine biosynthesis protein n=1 Tax=Gloeocapsopsis dulcis AAB1 = 1H9 TaxID=1433147 RepID=A0A6N8FUE0_9CHRO|nr:PhzF family phenazine biosynthesis protein [Gloeocapsopsis dulcis]MUL36738.1 phenazine biosynthesis protein [Gloeocapsopsis dulcis AAB1 = 1H9]WNN91312.1 PhzF family phenazine biosynthesis protein [Gloeocapsopsis dulcis]
MKFYIVDVFTQEKYAGNQLAVVIETGLLSTQQMQKIAKEMNYSETTFITSTNVREGGYDVRIFTPEQELPFAGHPTLGTAYILQKEIIKNTVNKIVLNLQVGQIPVTLYYLNESVEELWMQQKPPSFHQTFAADVLAQVLSLDLIEIDSKYPIQEVSTGIPFIIVPLKTHASLQRIKINRDKYFELVRNTQAKAILVFCPETNKSENDLAVRVFADAVGVPEDPATGSANGCLAGYLVKYSYFGTDSIDLRVEQGYEIGRPSLLLLKAQQTDTEIEVFVGGNVVMVASGEFV